MDVMPLDNTSNSYVLFSTVSNNNDIEDVRTCQVETTLLKRYMVIGI